MNSKNKLEDVKVNVKLKLAILWTSLMFLYIYVDYFALYMPEKVASILQGKVFVFEISQGFLMTALASMSIPALMIFLSVVLPAKANRWIVSISLFTEITITVVGNHNKEQKNNLSKREYKKCHLTCPAID